MSPEKLREHRRKLREQGICTRCHRNKADEFGKICTDCKAILWEKRKEKIDEGRCRNCLGINDRPHGVCSKCVPLARKYKQNMRDRRAERGLCTHCGHPSDGSLTCPTCNEVKNQHRMLSRMFSQEV